MGRRRPPAPRHARITTTFHVFDSIDPKVLALVAPLVVIQLGLMLVAVRDLLSEERAVRGGNKGLWALVIVFVNVVGPLVYLMVGRLDAPPPPDPRTTPAPGYGSPHDPPLVGRRPDATEDRPDRR